MSERYIQMTISGRWQTCEKKPRSVAGFVFDKAASGPVPVVYNEETKALELFYGDFPNVPAQVQPV